MYSNGDLRCAKSSDPTKRPGVCKQLEGYHKWACANEADILKAYAMAGALRRELHLRSTNRAPIKLDTTPRLLIVGFDSAQNKTLKQLKQTVVEKLQGSIPDFTAKHIRAVGSAFNVKPAHLS